MIAASLPDCLLEEVIAFLETPVEFWRFAVEASSSPSLGRRTFLNHPHWGRMYRARWPAFHEAMQADAEEQDWRTLYKETLDGNCRCLLEVFDREKKPGFLISAMPALVSWDGSGYIAQYLSASEVRPESIPPHEEHRLRFCPASAVSRLAPRGKQPVAEVPELAYSYKVLQDE